MKRFLPFLMLAIIASSQTIDLGQDLDLVGNARPFIDINDPDFLDVLAFVVQEHPEVDGWAVSQVTRQLVNGFNWRFTLK